MFTNMCIFSSLSFFFFYTEGKHWGGEARLEKVLSAFKNNKFLKLAFSAVISFTHCDTSYLAYIAKICLVMLPVTE